MRLKELRKTYGVSQEKLSKELSVSRSTVAMWESEKSQPDNNTLQKLADYFNVSVDYILGRTDDMNQNPGEENISFDDFTYAMYNESKELTEEDKQALLGMARLLKKKKQDQNG